MFSLNKKMFLEMPLSLRLLPLGAADDAWEKIVFEVQYSTQTEYFLSHLYFDSTETMERSHLVLVFI